MDMGMDAKKFHQRGKRHQTRLKAKTQAPSTTVSAYVDVSRRGKFRGNMLRRYNISESSG